MTSKIGLLWRGDPTATEQPVGRDNLLQPVFDALTELGGEPEGVVFAEEVVDDVREQLLGCDGVIVWVNPIQDGRDRSVLDAVLHEASAHGVWVSAHPHVILAMGTKKVLYDTRDLGWGCDTDLYETFDQFTKALPVRLASGEPRVLKQYRGNGGDGVWKVTAVASGAVTPDSDVVVDHAVQWTGTPKRMPLRDFIARCESYFEAKGRLIDQAFQPRLGDGMVRCYFVGTELVGFTHQSPKGLLDDPAARAETQRVRAPMLEASASAYQSLRAKAEGEWVPQMIDVLGLDEASLPVIWDADFLFGPKDAAGEDTYVLCEINVSAVWPYPPHATPKLAAAAVERTAASKAARSPA